MNFLRNLLQSKELEGELSSIQSKSLPVLEKDGHPDSYEFCTKYTEESCRTAQSDSLNTDLFFSSEKGCTENSRQEFFQPNNDITNFAENDFVSNKLVNGSSPKELSSPPKCIFNDDQSNCNIENLNQSKVNPENCNSPQYKLEYLEDPSFNPFKTRSAIRDSPPEQWKTFSQTPTQSAVPDLIEEPLSTPTSDIASNSLKPPKSNKNLSKPKFLSKKNKRNRHKGNNNNSSSKEETNQLFIDFHCGEKPQSATEKEVHTPLLVKETFRNSTSSDDQPFLTPQISPLISCEPFPKKESPDQLVTEKKISACEKHIEAKETIIQINETKEGEFQSKQQVNLDSKVDLDYFEAQSVKVPKNNTLFTSSPEKFVSKESDCVSVKCDSEHESFIKSPIDVNNGIKSDSFPKTCDSVPQISHSASELSLLASEEFEKTLGTEAQKLAEEINVSSDFQFEISHNMESANSQVSRRSFKIEGKQSSEESKVKLTNGVISSADDSGIGIESITEFEFQMNQSEAGPEIATGITENDLECASTFLKNVPGSLDDHVGRTLVGALGSQCKIDDPGVSSPRVDKSDNFDFCEPPREERSAPEGTSSPDPRSLETSEIKTSSSSLVRSEEMTELLKKQELQFEEKLLRLGIEAAEKEKGLRQTLKEERKELQETKSALEDVTSSRDALLKLVEQYKGMLSSLVSEKEKNQQGKDSSIKTLEAEKRQALEDLSNVEAAFSDVHRKYERTKQIVDALKRNEETLRGAVADYESKLQAQERKFTELQKHAEEKVKQASEEFESLRRVNDQEMTKMAALLKKAEMKIISLQESIDRKSRENIELTKLCDDLISKVGT